MEVQYNGTWGTVCDDLLGPVRRPGGVPAAGLRGAPGGPRSSLFGDGSGPIFLDDVWCTGNETSLGQCQHLGLASITVGTMRTPAPSAQVPELSQDWVSVPSSRARQAEQP